MAFADSQAALSHTPIVLVKMTLDLCDRIFGTSPCLATGTKCYNTRQTCKYTTAFLNTAGKVYKFTSADAPAPFHAGERPYVLGVSNLPTEINDERTVAGRVTIEFADEPDDDVLIDPYLSSRSSVQGTFWKKLLARNPNFKGRLVEIWEGYAGLAEVDYVQRFKGKIQDISLGKGTVSMEIGDSIVDLSAKFIPAKVDIKLRLAATISQDFLDLDSVAAIPPAPNWVCVDKEIIGYTAINTAGTQLTGCIRGQGGTVAATHSAGGKVGLVRYFAPDRATDQIGYILGLDLHLFPLSDFSIGLFTLWNQPDLHLPNTEAWITKPTKASDLIFELLELADAYMWVGEGLKLTFARRTGNGGGRTYYTLTDAQSIISGSTSAELDDTARITRVVLYWDKNPVATEDEDVAEYSRLDIAVDLDLEGASWYNEQKPRTIFSRWIRSTAQTDVDAYALLVRNMCLRILSRQKAAREVLTLEVTKKDSGLLTGDFAKISTDELLDINGNSLSSSRFQVMKREDLGDTVRLVVKGLSKKKLCIIGSGSLPDYTAANADQREYGYISSGPPAEGQMSNADDGYYIA